MRLLHAKILYCTGALDSLTLLILVHLPSAYFMLTCNIDTGLLWGFVEKVYLSLRGMGNHLWMAKWDHSRSDHGTAHAEGDGMHREVAIVVHLYHIIFRQ